MRTSSAKSGHAAAKWRASSWPTASEGFQVASTNQTSRDMLGPIKFRQQPVSASSEVGSRSWPGWTEVGGEVLQIEATLTNGRGGLGLRENSAR